MRQPRGLRTGWRLAWVVVGSVALHWSVLRVLPGGARWMRLEPPRPSIAEVEIAPPVAPSTGQPVPRVVEPPPPSVAQPVRAAAATRQRAEPRARSTAPSAEPEPAEPAPLPMAIAPTAPAVQAPAPRRLDLDPRRAALSALPLAETPAPATDDLATRRGAELSASLRAVASADADRLRQPRKLELRRDPDGTCHYSGSAIDATILPDGGVEFADKASDLELRPGAAEPPERPVTLEDTQAPQRLEFGVRLQPRAWDAERAWFLRETQSIRQELADGARERELRAAERHLAAELERIWCDASRPKPERRRAIFELWSDTSGDEIGARGRAVILEYVRRELPAGSPDAFTHAELLAFAALTGPALRFDPYAAAKPSDAGAAAR